MTAATQNNFAVTTDFADIVATIAGIGGASVIVQNIGPNPVAYVASGGSAPDPAVKSGQVLQPLDSIQLTTDHLWLRGLGGASVVSAMLT